MTTCDLETGDGDFDMITICGAPATLFYHVPVPRETSVYKARCEAHRPQAWSVGTEPISEDLYIIGKIMTS